MKGRHSSYLYLYITFATFDPCRKLRWCIKSVKIMYKIL